MQNMNIIEIKKIQSWNMWHVLRETGERCKACL